MGLPRWNVSQLNFTLSLVRLFLIKQYPASSQAPTSYDSTLSTNIIQRIVRPKVKPIHINYMSLVSKLKFSVHASIMKCIVGKKQKEFYFIIKSIYVLFLGGNWLFIHELAFALLKIAYYIIDLIYSEMYIQRGGCLQHGLSNLRFQHKSQSFLDPSLRAECVRAVLVQRCPETSAKPLCKCKFGTFTNHRIS